MQSLRGAPPAEIGGVPVTRVRDYLRPAGLPPSDVVKLSLQNESSAIIRPSGTEPQLKIYCFAQGKTRGESDVLAEGLARHLSAWAESIQKE